MLLGIYLDMSYSSKLSSQVLSTKRTECVETFQGELSDSNHRGQCKLGSSMLSALPAPAELVLSRHCCFIIPV